MRKYIIIFIGILILGSLVIYMPHFFSNYKQSKDDATLLKQQVSQNNIFRSIESNKNTVEQAEVPLNELESEQYEKSQIYYENIELLYKYLTFNQVAKVKQKLQFYLSNNLSNIKECKVINNKITNNKLDFTFMVTVKNYKDIMVRATKDDNGGIVDISISQSQ